MLGTSAEPHGFVDRREDLRDVLAFCRDSALRSPRCLLLRCLPGTGVTSFLKHLKFVTRDTATAVYADVAQDNEREIITKFFVEHSKRRLNLLSDPIEWWRLTAVALKALGAVAFPLPWVRPALAAGTDLAQPIIFTPFQSQPLEQFSRVVRSTRKKRPVFFFLDNAENNFVRIENLLATTHAPEYGHVKFVIAYVGKQDLGDEYALFREHVLTSFQRVKEHEFKGLTQELVSELATVRNLHLSNSECDCLIKQSAFNIWRLLPLLRNDTQPIESLSPTEAHILRLLIVAQQSLYRSDLWALSATSPLVHVESEDAWGASLKRLASLRLVEGTKHDIADTSIELVARNQPKVAAMATDDAGLLPVARDMYDYFVQADLAQTPRHPISYTAPLLYRLSRQIDPIRQAVRAQRLVEAALAQGSLREAKRYIDEARKGGAASVHDQFVQLAFYIACLDYEKAAEILNELGDSIVERHRILRLLRAVTLNRVRSHEKSLIEIDMLIAEPETSCHELSVLASYKTAGLLHECRWKEAAQFVDQIRRSISQAKGYGYFLRNAAAAFMWGECKKRERAEDFLTEAQNVMRVLRDSFGECTVLNNQGVLASYYRNFDQGLELFERAYSGLRVYGTHHLNEVGVNVGLGLLRLGRLQEAKAHLLRYCSITEWDLPRCFAENALALAEWLLDDQKSAVGRIKEAIYESARVKLIEAQQRTLFNATLLEAAANGPSAQFQQLVHSMRKTKWISEERIALLEENASIGKIPKEKLCDFWSLEYCQYWSQNPLALLPHEFLTL